MTGPWEIRFPPPIAPVRPGDAIKERRAPTKRPRRQPESEQDQEPPRDDDSHQIDDYA